MRVGVRFGARPMRVETLVVGPLGANCHVVACERGSQAAVVDPGGDADVIYDLLQRNEWVPALVICTHGHVDHIGGVGELLRLCRGRRPQVCIHEADAPMLVDSQMNLSAFAGMDVALPAADRLLRDGDVISFGEVELSVLHTPGHTPGGICLYAPGVLISGDTLFAASVGRTDFPGGSQAQLLSSINDRLLTLPPETEVYTGHGPPTTIADEIRGNPFLMGGPMP